MGYGISIFGTSNLIENNMVARFCKPIQCVWSGGGNVIAYNYVPESETVPAQWQENTISGSHGSFSHSDLFEGNYTANIGMDSTWGNNGYHVFFRNYATGRNESKDTENNLCAVTIGGWNRRNAVIGNVLLSPENMAENEYRLWSTPMDKPPRRDQPAVYKIGAFAWQLPGHADTGWDDTHPDYPGGMALTLMHRHLDFNLIENGVYDNPQNPVKALPDSLYLKNKPEFFGEYLWPPVNPFGAGHNNRITGLPAQDRYYTLEGRG
jgi:hypothetical protein